MYRVGSARSPIGSSHPIGAFSPSLFYLNGIGGLPIFTLYGKSFAKMDPSPNSSFPLRSTAEN